MYNSYSKPSFLAIEKKNGETVMKYFEIPEKEFEKFCNITLDELEFSVRTYCALRRGECETLADVAYLSLEEMQGLKNIGRRALEEVLDKMEEYNISFMTQAEKQQLLKESNDLNVLKRKIKRLEGQLKKKEDRIERYESERVSEWQKKRENKEQDLWKAHEIVNTSQYPIAGILQSMYWGKGCRFCEIFKLQDKNCFLENDSIENRDLGSGCEECIETFLADYYWKQKMDVKLAEEKSAAPKMMRMRMLSLGNGLVGRCPVCKQQHKFDKDIGYCFRCGTVLNWDEENWDEKIREYYDLLYYDEEEVEE